MVLKTMNQVRDEARKCFGDTGEIFIQATIEGLVVQRIKDSIGRGGKPLHAVFYEQADDLYCRWQEFLESHTERD